jgi:hypothetical protein
MRTPGDTQIDALSHQCPPPLPPWRRHCLCYDTLLNVLLSFPSTCFTLLRLSAVVFLFLFSSCIDGYSRKIIWLECASTNHDPAVIASYFVDAVRCIHAVPRKIRTDCGTENVTIAALTTFLSGRPNAHAYRTSPSNQRIEAWWSFFHRSCSPSGGSTYLKTLLQVVPFVLDICEKRTACASAS